MPAAEDEDGARLADVAGRLAVGLAEMGVRLDSRADVDEGPWSVAEVAAPMGVGRRL